MTVRSASPAHLRHRLWAAAGLAGAVTAGVLATPAAAATTAPSAAGAAADYPCVQYLTAFQGQTVRATWTYHIDAQGRPEWARAGTLSAGTSPRTKCETTVGNMGGTGYDGGHLIASTLKGVSKRINLVPMRHSVNIGIYKMFENGAKKCLKAPGMQVTNYSAVAHYPAGPSVVPDSFTVSMLPRKKGAVNSTIKLDIPNKDLSPQKAAGLKRVLNTGLAANKCGTVS
ncbi:DNA/RNA non-specific endonuclease [Streptoverticillium reticulum]|uniref:DNA/RNA non-specific endonuclease n=1 Tax=Streptoverticillium reticulum TaxID=1433415 RepID=UPI0039BF4FDC